MNTLSKWLASTALLLVSLPMHAITISVNPVGQTITTGASFDVALTVAGVGDGVAPSISTFDVNIGFDPSILGFNSVLFGDQLDLFGIGSVTQVINGTGLVNLFELSFDTVDDLNALQKDSFTLATLSFNALSAGTSALGIDVNALGDANGDPLQTDLVGARVTVNGGDNGSVPEPATWLLIGLGTLGMYHYRQQALRSQC